MTRQRSSRARSARLVTLGALVGLAAPGCSESGQTPERARDLSLYNVNAAGERELAEGSPPSARLPVAGRVHDADLGDASAELSDASAGKP